MDQTVIRQIRKALKDNADEKTKNSAQRFFKEKVLFYGVKSHVVEKIAKEFFGEVKDENKKEFLALCEELFKSDYCEEEWIAANWAYWNKDIFQSSDIKIFECWIDKYIGNWASCDTLCNHAVGAFVDAYPHSLKTLKKWGRSKNRWMRRASSVTLIVAAKEGRFLKDIFDIAMILLKDQDDMVQKGYGWMLKAASMAHQKEVFSFVMKNKKEMPRTALRYAIEKMPQGLRKRAMAK